MNMVKDYKEVIKRDGTYERLDTNKIQKRIDSLKNDPEINKRYGELFGIDSFSIALKTEKDVYNNITTTELDDATARIMQPMGIDNPDYIDMAGRILINSSQKNSLHYLYNLFPDVPQSEISSNLLLYTCEALYANVNASNTPAPLLAPQFLGLVRGNYKWLESIIDYYKDYSYGFEAYKILEVGNILQRKNHSDNSIICSERIQHFHMRVAVQAVACPENPREVHKKKLPVENFVREFTDDEKQKISDTYWALSEKYYINSTATGFNSGSIRPQLSACYLTTQRKDSLKGINEWFSDYSFMAKFSGGVGSSIHTLRCTNSYISKTNGYSSNGIKSWLSIAAKYAKSVDQAGGKRPGSHAIYLEPWHGDIETFISMADKLNDNYEPNIKIAIWMCDEFMRCVIKEIEVEQVNGQAPKLWYLMDPNISKGLNSVYDDIHVTTYISDAELRDPKFADRMKFTALYRKYIAEGKYVKQVSASSIFRNIIIRQIEGGTPYITSKDSINRKTNQNDTTHQCSNLCVEINEVVSDKETAVCNLANLNLPRFFDPDATDKDLPINWDMMEKVIRIAVTNLNRLVDVSFYPIKKAEFSNKKRRPMGLGIQGMADLHVLCGFPYDSAKAEHLEFKLLEFMYMIALDQSAELAKLYGTYENYSENRISQGLLQQDLWMREYQESLNPKKLNPLPYELHPRWADVRANIAAHGQRNSLLIALMPTASTYMITGSSPCFEPFNGMVYKRRAKSGEIIIVNKSLIRKLQSMGIWSPKIKNEILASRTGSIAEIADIPAEIRALYKTVWDISPKVTASRAILRGVFVDQSQSLNLFIAAPSIKILSQYHLYQFSRSAKTYSYYTRSLSATDANKIEAQPDTTIVTETPTQTKQVVCTDEVCVVCQ